MIISNDFISESGRWQAVRQRDAQASGMFVYGVVTTGVYCRPTCCSRLPNRENVRFFDRWQEAEEKGFRPCRRCYRQHAQRSDPAIDLVAKACQIIKESERPPSLDELAAELGISSSHLHRLFKKTVGITPKQYTMADRLQNRF